MNVKKVSRGSTIDYDKCTENMDGNRFNLVLAAAIRAREISKANRSAGRVTYECSPVSALIDVQNGKVTPEYLKRIR